MPLRSTKGMMACWHVEDTFFTSRALLEVSSGRLSGFRVELPRFRVTIYSSLHFESLHMFLAHTNRS